MELSKLLPHPQARDSDQSATHLQWKFTTLEKKELRFNMAEAKLGKQEEYLRTIFHTMSFSNPPQLTNIISYFLYRVNLAKENNNLDTLEENKVLFVFKILKGL